MRVPLSFVANELEEYEFDQMGEPITDKDWLPMVTRQIASDAGVNISSVRVWWCGPVSEYCIYINGKWSGYVDLEKYGHNVIGGMCA